MAECKKVAQQGVNVLHGIHRLICSRFVLWGRRLRCLLKPESLIFLFFVEQIKRKNTLSSGGEEIEANPQRSD